MLIQNRIWEEIKQAKTNILCIQEYTDSRRRWNRRYAFFVGFLSGIGALTYNVYEMIPVYTSIIIGLVTLIKSTIPNLMQTEPELSKLDGLYSFYAHYLNDLEKIWYDLRSKNKTEEESIDLLLKLKETECDKEVAMNRYLRTISKRLQKNADKRVEEYIDRIYNQKQENNEQQNTNKISTNDRKYTTTTSSNANKINPAIQNK